MLFWETDLFSNNHYLNNHINIIISWKPTNVVFFCDFLPAPVLALI